jgi:hypothetical protein
MNFVLWHKKLVQKISTRSLALLVFGKLITSFSLGTLFSETLLPYAKIFLFLGLTLIFSGLTNHYLTWHTNKPVRYIDFFLGFLGTFLLAIYFGMLYPELPFKIVLLLVGVASLLPAIYELLKN